MVVMAPRIVLCCLAVPVLAGCGSDEREQAAPAPAPVTQVMVRVDPDGKGPEPAKEAQIRCREREESRTCGAASGLRPSDLEPTAGDVACTDIFGGPQTATISGTLNARRVSARFSRSNGCEVARWEKVAPLLQAAG